MMDTYNTRIQKVVRSRVRIIHTFYSRTTTAALAVLVALTSLWGVGREVWVARVFANMPSVTNGAAVMQFYLAAFMNTRFIVQVLVVLVIASVIWLVRSCASLIRPVRQFA
jgi:hypothetical protein